MIIIINIAVDFQNHINNNDYNSMNKLYKKIKQHDFNSCFISDFRQISFNELEQNMASVWYAYLELETLGDEWSDFTDKIMDFLHPENSNASENNEHESRKIQYNQAFEEYTKYLNSYYAENTAELENILKSSPKGTFKAVIPVDFAGYPVDGERLRALADEYGFAIVEDACHAPGGSFIDSKGIQHMVGDCAYADMTVFSYHPVKHIATGEGGSITTNRKDLFDKLSLYRTHGITKDPELLEHSDGVWYYEMQELGYNYRITDFQAALGISQLKRLNWSIQRRQEIAERYNKAFMGTCIKTPVVASNVSHAYHLYIIQLEQRKGLYDFLRENEIFAQVLYVPVHTMPYYRKFGWKKGDMPVAEDYYEHCLALPMFPSLTNEEQEYVIQKVLEFVNK